MIIIVYTNVFCSYRAKITGGSKIRKLVGPGEGADGAIRWPVDEHQREAGVTLSREADWAQSRPNDPPTGRDWPLDRDIVGPKPCKWWGPAET